MAFTNVTLFNATTGWESDATQESGETTGVQGKYIRNLYVDLDPGAGAAVTVTLRVRVRDPIDDSWIYLAGQGAPNTNAVIFNAYSLSAQLKKWIAVAADITAQNNNGFLMLPGNFSVQLALGGTPAADTTITMIAQLDDGLS